MRYAQARQQRGGGHVAHPFPLPIASMVKMPANAPMTSKPGNPIAPQKSMAAPVPHHNGGWEGQVRASAWQKSGRRARNHDTLSVWPDSSP